MTRKGSPGFVLRRFLIGDILGIAFLAFLGWFVYAQRAEIANVSHALITGYWPWLILAVALEGVYLIANARYYQVALEIMGIKFTLARTLALRLTAEILSVLTASEFLTTQAVFLYNAREHELSRSRTAFGILTAQLAELSTFLILLLPTLLALVHLHRARDYEIIAGYTLFGLLILILGLLAVLFSHPEYTKGLLRLGQRLARSLGKRRWISNGLIDRAERSMREITAIIREDSGRFLPAFYFAMLGQFLRIACFMAVLLAFRIHLSYSLVLTTYCLGTLVWIISPIPQGIGLVEGAYGLALVSFGIRPAIATTIALAFRGIVFWLPFIGGLPVFSRFRPRVVELPET